MKIRTSKIETRVNSFGETVTSWTSHKHPECENFMQVVNWRIYQKEGKTTVLYFLDSTVAKPDYVNGITRDEAIQLYTDYEDVPTEDEFQQWLSNQK